MPATDEQKAILAVLLLLQRLGEEWRWSERRRTARDPASVAVGRFTHLRDYEVENYILHGGVTAGAFDYDQAIYIRPPRGTRTAVSVLWCRWDFGQAVAAWGFHVGIWSKRGRRCRSPRPSGDEELAFVGFRYETPGCGGNHNYYHAQPCRTLAKDGPVIVEALPISDRNPTWPLAAESPLELLLCFVMSLYGREGIDELACKVQEDVRIRRQQMLLSAIRKMQNLGSNN